ncbi:neural cell adhesion molecule 2-like [Dermacentor andersoni]|uniref:neural cell adhesion molecule 2-like n=1 Tax=Dermacentor andersoni TaxID=34620 RepID=UPI00215586F2|nr:hemicentin-2-like [Dermacentor andersoni]
MGTPLASGVAGCRQHMHYLGTLVCFVLTLSTGLWTSLQSGVAAQYLQPQEERTSISVNEGQQTELPCVTRQPAFNGTHNVQRVRWFHEPHFRLGRDVIYTVDVGGQNSPYPSERGSNPNQVARWVRKEWQGRAYFSFMGHPHSLKIINLRHEDKGTYVCSVTFRDGTTRNATVYLQVIVPPEPPVIMDTQGNVLSGKIGPFNESSRLSLICEVRGGKPAPTLTWRRNGEPVYANAMATASGDVRRSTLTLHNLRRQDLMALYSCVSSNNVSIQGEAAVTLDMNLSPTMVQIRRTETPISAGLPAEILCEVWGSRPPPDISWWKNSVQLEQAFVHVSQDGNLTTSVVEFTPMHSDNGETLVCRAENKRMPGSVREDQWDLNVHYRPKLRLQMDPNLGPDRLQEGMDITLGCSVDANPAIRELLWQRDGRPLLPTKDGVTVHREALTIQKATLMHLGNYTCSAANREGRGLSNVVELRLKHAPVCKSGQRLVYATRLSKLLQVSCEVQAQPPAVTFRWRFNNSLHQSARMDTYSWEGTRSVARYAVRSHQDYGTLLCWARNQVGDQRQPCVFVVVPAGSEFLVSNEGLIAMLICLLFVLIILVVSIYFLIKWRRRKLSKDEQRLRADSQASCGAASAPPASSNSHMAASTLHSMGSSRSSNGNIAPGGFANGSRYVAPRCT